MPLHRIRFYLRLTLACIALATVEVLVWGFLSRKPDVVQSTKSDEGKRVTSLTADRELPAIADFTRLFARPLRQPLNADASATPTAAATGSQKSTPLTIRLMGTIMDGSGRWTAIVSDRSGGQEMKGVGERVGGETGPTIVEVAMDRLVLDQRGVRTTIPLERPPAIESLLQFRQSQPNEPPGRSTL